MNGFGESQATTEKEWIAFAIINARVYSIQRDQCYFISAAMNVNKNENNIYTATGTSSLAITFESNQLQFEYNALALVCVCRSLYVY